MVKKTKKSNPGKENCKQKNIEVGKNCKIEENDRKEILEMLAGVKSCLCSKLRNNFDRLGHLSRILSTHGNYFFPRG